MNNKKKAYYSDIHETPIIGQRGKLILKDGTIIQTSRIIAINGNTIETLNTIYEKEVVLKLHQLSYEEKLEKARALKIIC